MGYLIEKGKKYLSPVQAHYTELEVERAEGVYLYTTDGKKILDFSSGIAVVSNCHCHPEVTQAICEQSKKLIHICAGIAYYQPQVDLAEELVNLSPYDNASVFLTQSGSEAIEAAMKLAKKISGKSTIAAFSLAFHGRTIGALSVTYKQKYRKGYENWLIQDVINLNYPYCYRCPYEKQYGNCGYPCISDMKEKLLPVKDDLVGVVIEPIAGEGGYIPAPVEFIQELRYFTEEIDTLLIFDEIQSGIGRTGAMFAAEHYDVVPDIMTLAKGIASGMPLGACIAEAELMNAWTPASHGGTYPGNPVVCAAALATLKVIEEQNLCNNAYYMGQYMKRIFIELKERYDVIGDVRGVGLMIGIEFIDPQTGDPNSALVVEIRQAALCRGLLLISCGEYDQVLRFVPPLIIDQKTLQHGIDIFTDVLKELCG